MKSKSVIYFVVMLFFVGGFFIGCNKQAQESVKIGVIMPLTGGAAVYGVPSVNAMKLALEQFKEKKQGNFNVDFIVEDSQADAAKGVSAIQKLISADKVKMVLGPLASGVTLACAPVAERNKVILLSPSSSAPAITQAGEYIFRTELSDFQGGEAQADFAIEKLDFKKIACLYINNDYGASLNKVFKERFEEKGGVIEYSEGFKQDETDFKKILTKINSLELDAIFVISHNEILNLVRQKAELGIKTPIYTTPVFEDQRNLEKLGELANGIIYTYYGKFDVKSEEKSAKSFVEAYKAKFNEPPTYYAALAYDAANILLHALDKNKLQTENLKEVLQSIKGFFGVTGQMSFDPNGDIIKPVSLKYVKEKNFVFHN